MLPRLHQFNEVQTRYLEFLSHLEHAGFNGDIAPDYANRTVLATDNSIYQVLPQAVVFPKNTQDIVILCQLAGDSAWTDIVLSPRGGGTGTNGQSLTDGIVVDLSRHMNDILEINVEERWVRVQPGVVKDQLNRALKPHGLFFAPELSTSNRATIGGMINTDASGQGSVQYGKTRDHVLALETVILGGDKLTTEAIDEHRLTNLLNESSKTAELAAIIKDIHDRRKDDISDTFPPLNRCLTGYDLAHIYDNKQFNLNNILCGSEGTLGFISEAKLNVLSIPKYSALVNVFYDSFEASLRDAQKLMQAKPTSIETIDDTVLELAQGDNIWHTVKEFFQGDGRTIHGINLVEFTSDDKQALEQKIQGLTQTLQQADSNIGYSIAQGNQAVQQIWAMRKKAVGLLGNAKGEARPIPFVEDTAVPPENLADFIMDFRRVLDRENLRYGMFGHVDAGVLHVRPALDMKDAQQEKLVRNITDEVVELVRQYNGLLWGEHGKGLRSEFAPEFFGDLYPELQRIKRAFDPNNQLNPGKIATTEPRIPLKLVDEVTTRGELDRTITPDHWQHFSESLYCNGNGACYNYDPNDAMCPSWKITRDRKHSPKGRASLIREWVRLLSNQQPQTEANLTQLKQGFPLLNIVPKAMNAIRKRRGQYDFSHEVADSMSLCLSCKSCTGQCPIKVDVPEFRAKFYQLYHSRYFRPLKDYAVASLEFVLPLFNHFFGKRLFNAALNLKIVNALMESFVGLSDTPNMSLIRFRKAMKQRGVLYAEPNIIGGLTDSEKQKSVVIVQDAFTSFFETQLVIDIIDLLQSLGFRVWVMPFRANGKPLHVHGFLKLFRMIASRQTTLLRRISDQGLPLIGVDPSMTLTFRSEYTKYCDDPVPKVWLPQEFLAQHVDRLKARQSQFRPSTSQLLAHCTEKTNAVAATKDWQQVFQALNQQLDLVDVGCCGMAGTFGHESKNKTYSKGIYDLSWREAVNNSEAILLATGYSCRSQVKRFDEKHLLHPLQYLLKQRIIH